MLYEYQDILEPLNYRYKRVREEFSLYARRCRPAMRALRFCRVLIGRKAVWREPHNPLTISGSLRAFTLVVKLLARQERDFTDRQSRPL